MSTHSTTTLHSSIQKPTARHLVQARREHARNNNTVRFQAEADFFLGETNKNIFWETIRPNSKFFFLPVLPFSVEKPTFPAEKIGFSLEKTNFFLRKGWFSMEKLFFRAESWFSIKQTFPKKNKSFGKLYGQTPKRLVFPKKKLVFGGKTNFCLG